MKNKIYWSFLLSFCVCWSAVGWGQAKQPSTLRGQISDPNLAAVSAAKIMLQQAGKTVQETTTDVEGRFVVSGLPAGQYGLMIEAAGFSPAQKSVTMPTNNLVKIQLAVAAIQSDVVVKSQDKGLSLDTASSANNRVLKGAELQRLPRDETQLLRVLQRLSGSLTETLDLRVNGVAGAKLPPLETIKEIRINNDPYSAAFHEPASARIEIETKGGGEEIQAGGFFHYRNSALDARNPFSFDKPPLEHRDYGGWWSSRLIGSRTFIFGAFEQRRHDAATIVSAFTADGYYGDNVPLLNREWLVNLRGDYTPSERHAISFFYDFARSRDEGQGITSLDLPERAFQVQGLEHSLQASVRSFLSANLVNEATAKYTRERVRNLTDNFDEAVEVAGSFTSGGAQCCPAASVRHHVSLTDNLSLLRGSHFFKTGVHISGVQVQDNSENNFGGSWLYSNVQFYRLHRPLLYTLNVGTPELGFGLWQMAGYAQDEIKLKSNFTLTPGLRYEAQTQGGGYRNFAPRLSLAWSPSQSNNTVIRAGAGLFYQQLGESQVANALRFDGIWQKQVIVYRPRYPNPFGSRPLEAFPISLNRLASDLQLPQQWHSSVGIERQLPRDATLTLTYAYVRGVHFLRSRDVNAPLADGLRPLAQFWRITQLESSATSTTHRLQASYSQTLNARVTLFGNYTWGRIVDDTDGADTFPMDNYQVRSERGFAALDMRHQAFVGAMLTLPLKLELTPMFAFNSGRPYNLTTGLDDNNDSILNDRPAGVARNSGRGPRFASLDVGLSRQLSFGSRQQDQDSPFGLNFSVQFTNLLNHTNFADFTGNQASPFFGRANSAHDARQMMIQINFNLH
ncbi:MAG: TonB-dependent receptor [Blastocatellia bacterium]